MRLTTQSQKAEMNFRTPNDYSIPAFLRSSRSPMSKTTNSGASFQEFQIKGCAILPTPSREGVRKIAHSLS
jgi:hypothetical protein